MKTKYRLKFSKLGKMKFIGHLDLQTTFQRAVKRAGLPICYSEGYNPHQLISFALPLPIGMESVGEYADFLLEEEPEAITLACALNDALPIGLTVTSALKLPPDEKSAAAQVDGADYEIRFPDIDIASQLSDIIEKEKVITVRKESKKGVLETDIRPDIHKLSVDGDLMTVRLSAGGRRMLKPQLLTSSLCERGASFNPDSIRYSRIDLLKRIDSVFIPLIP